MGWCAWDADVTKAWGVWVPLQEELLDVVSDGSGQRQGPGPDPGGCSSSSGTGRCTVLKDPSPVV